MEQYSFWYEILGGCHNFWWQERYSFLGPVTSFLYLRIDFRVGVKFLENEMIEEWGV